MREEMTTWASVAPSRPRTAEPRRLTIGVGIATVGRPHILSSTIAELYRQTRAADDVVVCSPAPSDVAGLERSHSDVTWVFGPSGLPCQRNAILDRMGGSDVVVFLDDDFLVGPRFIEAVEAVFLRHPEVVMATGRVLADGIRGPGLSHDEARQILRGSGSETCDPDAVVDVESGYGCNMAVRLEPIRTHGLRFDERLPLYAWLEDVDFSRRLARYGRVVRATSAHGVHLGVKSGRQSGRRLGYSQIANPIYLVRKGTCSRRRALRLMIRNVAANLIRSPNPEPYVDRRGRAAGNALALLDLLTGRLDPSRALSLS